MAFEVKEKDLLGRIGLLHTKSGVIETPHMLPVVNPRRQPVSPKAIYEDFGCKAIITNAYLVRKYFGESEVHQFLGFPGVVATDSGAYQTLHYGEAVDASSADIVRFQEAIGTDIGVILDIPTSSEASREEAEETVRETISRADEFFDLRRREDILWVGPIQGGVHLDILERSAKEMARRDFALYAIGSPTTVMEAYDFPRLVDMIMTVKRVVPVGKPIHLFGAGHPMVFPLAVALGCDLFDSASYALFARAGRYLTEFGTLRFEDMSYFPCSCASCARTSPEEVRSLPPARRESFLASHNLRSCLQEIARIKEAITEGRLWELLEARSRAHPQLRSGMEVLGRYGDFLEKHSPSIKGRGMFYFDHISLLRPEVLRHRKRLTERYGPPRGKSVLLLLPQPEQKPYHGSELVRRAMAGIPAKAHICLYGHPFGVTPVEIDDVYPLSQFEACAPDAETCEFIVEAVAEYVEKQPYRKVFLVDLAGSGLEWSRLRNVCRGRKRLELMRCKRLGADEIGDLLKRLRKFAKST